jgi:hypothetical protein
MASPTDRPKDADARLQPSAGAKHEPDREERLAQALKNNLRRRKAAARAGGDR